MGIGAVHAAVAAILLGVNAVVGAAPSSDTTTVFTCAPVAVLTLRGSGEPAGSGPILDGILTYVRDTVLKDGYSPTDVPVIPVPYPAVPADQYLSTDKTDLFESIERGVLYSSVIMDAYVEQCGEGSSFLLMGYSQGVIVAREVASQYPQTQIAGVFGVGDPAQHGGEAGITGVGRNGDGLYRWLTRNEDDTSDLDDFYDAGLPYAMYCHADDWICNFYNPDRGEGDGINPLFQTYDHVYPSDPVEGAVMGAQIAVMLRDATIAPDPTPGEVEVRSIDVVFTIDTTGSMEPYIDRARRKARETASALVAGGNDVRVGVVAYRDRGDEYVTRTVLPLTSELDRLRPALAGLVADGGGDTPESVYSGIVEALRASWREDAARSVVVLGDAPAHDPEPGTHLTLSKVAELARGAVAVPDLPPTLSRSSVRARTAPAGPVDEQVSVFGLADDDELYEQLADLGERTGGTAARLRGPSGTASALTDLMASITDAPTAVLSVPGPVFAGVGTVLSAALSTGPATPLYYEFDIDGDGSFERGGRASTVIGEFSTSGMHRARVLVTDADGRTAEATVDVDVRDPEFLPDAPTKLALPPDRGSPRWPWLAGAGSVVVAAGAGALVVLRLRRRT